PRFSSTAGLTRKCEWYKVSKRREMDISTVAACFTVDLDGDGIVRYARLAYGGVAAMSARALKTEEALLGKPWTLETIQSVLPVLQTEFTPISDVRGAAEYRSGLITSLLERFYSDSSERSEVGGASVPASRGDRATSAAARLAGTLAPPAALPLPHESAHKHVTGEA